MSALLVQFSVDSGGFEICGSDEIGRHAALRGLWEKSCRGSNPLLGSPMKNWIIKNKIEILIWALIAFLGAFCVYLKIKPVHPMFWGY